MATDWHAWHERYDRPGSWLDRRLAVVQRHLAAALDAAAAGPVRLVSVCAGQGRDVLGVLESHDRRGDVRARLVELDAGNAEAARRRAGALGLVAVEVVRGDASHTTAFAGAAPADVLLVCGVFGNVPDDDIRNTVAHLPMLCAPHATVIWTRYPRDATILDTIDGWFADAGFECVARETGDDGAGFGVGVHRLVAEPAPFRPGIRLFTFLDEPDPGRVPG